MVDPYMNDVPWEIIYDENGKVLAEIYLLPARYLNDGLVRKGKRK